MKMALIHLSDIHFETKNNPVKSRAKKIKSAIQALSAEIDLFIVPVTGDIAFSGKGAEYRVAESFFSELHELFRTINPAAPVHFIFVPGNHDCDLSGDQEVRDSLVANVPSKLTTLDPTKGVVRQCLAVQKNFFEFESFTGEPTVPLHERLYYERFVDFDGKRFRFNCYNTAWLAQITKGFRPLYYPVHIAAPRARQREASDDLVISLFHYPYGWLEPDNSLEFKRLIDQTSDLILSGHEHSPSGHLKVMSTGGETYNLEGAALQESHSKESGFNVMLIDMDAATMKVFHFKWANNLYQPSGNDQWFPFRKNSLIERIEFSNLETFKDELSRDEYGFDHQRKKDGLKLRDLYVYPDFSEEGIDRQIAGKSIGKLIEGQQIIEYLLSNYYVLLLGEEEAGKTTLAKILYEDLKQQHLHPLMLKASDVALGDETKFLRDLRRVFSKQYPSNLFEHYRQLDKDKRVLIIDNFHSTRLNGKGQNEYLEIAKKWFGRIILIASDTFPVQLLASGVDETPVLREFRHCTMRSFGWRRRGHLINKWLMLGREFTADLEEVEAERKLLMNAMDAVLGKNLFPSTPLTVLAILQSFEATKSHNVGSGAIGQIYEALITKAVFKISKKPTDIEKIYIFLSHVAHAMFVAEKTDLSIEEIRVVANKYFEHYGVSYDVPQLLEDLKSARILRSAGGAYRFEPRHYYYYFVARYFSTNLSNPTHATNLRQSILYMVDTVNYEEYAHILDFLTYFIKEDWLYERMIQNARSIYSDQSPCDMEHDVKFVNELITEIPQLELPDTNVSQNRDKRLAYRDQIDEEVEPIRSKHQGSKVAYDKELDDIIKLNIAFKTIDLMGQVVRNFPYAVPADTKEAIVRECELLGLRALNAIFAIAKVNLDECKTYFAQLIKERRALDSDMESRVEADNFLIWLTEAIGFGIIKRVSHAVGAQELSQTYHRVLTQFEEMLGIRLIDISIKFDNFNAPPTSEVEKLSKETKENPYTFSVLRDLAWDFLYQYHTDERTRQRLIAALDLRSTPTMLDNPLKRLGRGTQTKKYLG